MADQSNSEMPVWMRRIGYGVGTILGLIVLTIVTAWLFIKSPFGEALVVDAITGMVEQSGDFSARVGDIEGDLPSSLTLRDVVLSDQQGDWLTLNELSVQWQPWALLAGRVDVDFLAMDTATVARQPVIPPSTSPTEPVDLEGLADVLARVTVESLTVDQINVAPEAVGLRLSLSLDAALGSASSGRPQLTATVRDIDTGGESTLTAVLAREETIRVEAQANLAGSSLEARGALVVPTNAIVLTGSGNVTPTLYPVEELEFDSANVNFSVNGTVDAPVVQLSYDVVRPQFGSAAFTRLDGTADLSLTGDQVSIELAGGAAGTGALIPDLSPLLASDTLYALSGTLNLADDPNNRNVFNVREVFVESGDLSITGLGTVDIGAVSAAGRATLRARGLGRLAGWLEDESETELELDIASASALEVRAAFQGATDALTTTSDMLTTAVAGPIQMSGTLVATPDRVRVDEASLSGLNGSLDGVLDVDLNARSIEAELEAAITNLAVLSPDLEGPIRVAGDVSGPLGGPQVLLQLASDRIAIRQETLDAVNLVLEADLNQTPMEAVIKGSVEVVEGQVVVDIRATESSENAIRLRPISLQGAGIDVTGDITLDRADGMAVGSVEADFETLALPAAVTAIPLSGRSRTSLELSRDEGVQTARFQGRAEDLRYAGAEAGLAELTAEGVWRGGAAAELEFSLTGENGFIGGQSLASVSLEAEGPISQIAVELVAQAPGEVPQLAIEGAIDSSGDALVLSLDALSLTDTWGGLALVQPARVEVGDQAIRSDQILLAAEGGRLAAQFDIDQVAETVKASLTGEDLPLDLWATLDPDLPITGRFDLSFALQGDLASPRGSASLYTTDISLPDTGLESVGADIDLTLVERRLTLSANVMGLSETPATITGSLPFILNLSDSQLSVPLDQSADMSVKWSGDIQPIWAVLPLVTHRVAGQAEVDLEVSGTLNEPDVTGYARLVNGSYENLELGTVLRDLDLNISTQTVSDFTLNLSGTDGDNGVISGTGVLARQLGGELLGEFKLTMDRLRLVRRDDLKVRGGGQLVYTLTPERDRIEGDVTVESAELSLTASYVEAVPTLDVVDPNAPQPAPRVQRAGKETDLAITVAAPNSLDVVGRGLDSEWTAQLTLDGTLAAPELVGGLDVVRGEFSFLGELFDLSQGEVRFTGGGQIDPDLAIVATRSTGGITARVEVRGRASSPSITLASDPPLPQDEVLSRILFGRSAGQLGPLEAVQLANAATELGGLAGRGGVVGTLRRGVGLDVFRFGSDAGGSTVVVGERLSKNIFVGVEQGLEGQGSQFIIEWQLTDNLGLKSTTRQDTGADIGLRWSRDY